MSKPLSQIETTTDSYITHYPWAVKFAQDQQSVFWPAEELGVEEDAQDFLVNLNEAEKHGVLTAQSILTQYELMIGGDELWGGRIAKLFPRPEIQRMAACFANVELNSHAPFYAIGNEVIGVATDEFYTQWKRDPVMSQRIAFINDCAHSKDALVVTAALAFMEGAVLFSIFGFFKAFNCRGLNFIPHFVAGIDGSAKDEDFHSRASAQLFNTCRAERRAAGNHSGEDEAKLQMMIAELANTVYAHELQIIDKLFAVPGNRASKKEECIHFLQDRINIVLVRLGCQPMFDAPPGEISSWFYNQLSTVKVSDFFAATQLQYTSNWAKNKLTFRKEMAYGV